MRSGLAVCHPPSPQAALTRPSGTPPKVVEAAPNGAQKKLYRVYFPSKNFIGRYQGANLRPPRGGTKNFIGSPPGKTLSGPSQKSLSVSPVADFSKHWLGK